MLTVRALTKTYAGPDGPVPVLRGVNLDVAAGETLALTGESGSGKSTLLHLVAGLDRPDSGSIRLAGHEIAGLPDRALAAFRRRRVALVFQQFNLVPALTVAANIALQARMAGRYDAALNARLAERLGLVAHLAKFPEALSGGQQQRVAIARALAAQPELVLADEPTGNLDEATADGVMALMLDLVRDSGAALLMVTHSARAASLAHRRLALVRGEVL